MSRQVGKRLSLPRGLTFHRDYNQGLITAKGTAHCPFPALEGEHRLSIPGETEFNGWRVISSILARQPRVKQDNEFKACFDFDIVGDDLTVRKRRRGERFHPLGMDAAKKLQDFMVDARIPRHWRDRVPLVCSSQHVAWVVGWRIDQRVRITDSTTRVLCLEFVNMYDQG
jgi:tRNA(Ile)-lysidine synthase